MYRVLIRILTGPIVERTMVGTVIGIVVVVVIVVVIGIGEAANERGYMQRGVWLMASSQIAERGRR